MAGLMATARDYEPRLYCGGCTIWSAAVVTVASVKQTHFAH